MNELQTVLLIDDDNDINYLHTVTLEEGNFAKNIKIATGAEEALTYLTQISNNEVPELIFLDLNMPGKNGWDFLEAYKKLPFSTRKQSILYVLTTTVNPDDEERANQDEMVAGFESKLLDTDKMKRIIARHFAK